jgi:hypothetical protein
MPTQTTAPRRSRPFRAEPWPEADALFRGDAHWVGGDGCYSIDLGDGRVLWTFGDSVHALRAGRPTQ